MDRHNGLHMSIAIKNGGVILKNGKAAESCGCCGGGFSCSCSAPQQMQLEFANSVIGDFGSTDVVVATQAAYTAAFGSQITGVQMGTFDANSPYPNEPYYGVAGYLYQFVFVDPVLGSAPEASSLQGNCTWAEIGGLYLRAYAMLRVMRRASSSTSEGFDCFYLEWTYGQQGLDASCNLTGWGATSGWSVLPNGGGNNPYITPNFAHKVDSPCCISPIQPRQGRALSVSGVADYQGSGRMTVLDCA
jgi:hypothetical protein